MVGRVSFIAAVLAPLALFACGMPSQRQPGSMVDESVAASIYGGCGNEFTTKCAAVGTCAATSIAVYSGCGNWKQGANTTNCGVSGSCVSCSVLPSAMCGN